MFLDAQEHAAGIREAPAVAGQPRIICLESVAGVKFNVLGRTEAFGWMPLRVWELMSMDTRMWLDVVVGVGVNVAGCTETCIYCNWKWLLCVGGNVPRPANTCGSIRLPDAQKQSQACGWMWLFFWGGRTILGP